MPKRNRYHAPKRTKPKNATTVEPWTLDTPLGDLLTFRPVPLKVAARPAGEPDEAEIARRAAAIRAAWSPMRRRQAEGAYAPQRVAIHTAAAPRLPKGLGGGDL